MQNNIVSEKYLQSESNHKHINHQIECQYYLSLAICVCEVEVAEISRVWANDELLNLEQYKCRIYLGSEY